MSLSSKNNISKCYKVAKFVHSYKDINQDFRERQKKENKLKCQEASIYSKYNIDTHIET